VSVSMFVLAIFDVSEHTNDFTLEFYFRQHWNDARLAYRNRGDADVMYLDELTTAMIWLPDPFIVNAKRMQQNDVLSPHVFTKLLPNGDILRSNKLTVTAHCPMSLRNYPADTQVCELLFESYGYTANDMELAWKEPNAVGMVTDMIIPNFHVKSFSKGASTISITSGTYGRLSLSFEFSRFTSRFVTQIYMPSFLVMCVALMSMWLYPCGQRVALQLVAFLAILLLHSDANAMLPEAHSSNTRLDVYVLSCLVFVTVILVLNIVTLLDVICVEPPTQVQASHRSRTDEMELVNDNSSSQFNSRKPGSLICCGPLKELDIDRYVKLALPSLFLAFNVLFLLV